MDGKENSVNDSKLKEAAERQQLWGAGSHSFFLNTGHLQVLIKPVEQF